MSNKDLLTEAELRAYKPDPRVLAHIEACRARFRLDKDAFKILDWGCGRGKCVLWLRAHGYDAAGVDVDAMPFANGEALFRDQGQDTQSSLHAVNVDGAAPFADASFHFIVSEQTLEHVRDLAGAVADMRRITIPGGGGFHEFPAHRRFLEPHLSMPVVHWLPKNRLRRGLIGACVVLGVQPHWWPKGQMTSRSQTDIYYAFSVDETFYRPPDVIIRCFEEAGFRSNLVVAESGWRGGAKLARLLPAGLVDTWKLDHAANLQLTTTLCGEAGAS